jgi:hypothetical protein
MVINEKATACRGLLLVFWPLVLLVILLVILLLPVLLRENSGHNLGRGGLLIVITGIMPVFVTDKALNL